MSDKRTTSDANRNRAGKHARATDGHRSSPTPRQTTDKYSRDRRRSQGAGRPSMAGSTRSGKRRLGRDEVAAVNYDRSYYVSDGPSPYLTPDQAREDIRRTKRRHSTVATVVIIMIVLAVVGGGVGFVWSTTRPTTEATQVWQYRTEEIYRGEFLATIETTALIRPVGEENISPTVSGNIAEISAVEGATVAAGDPLYKLENNTISESFKNAEKAFTEAQAQVNAKTQALEEISATIQALEAASAADPNNRATQAALASSYTKIDPAQVELNAATQTLSSMKETYERAKTQEEALTILSPIEGTVNQVNPDVLVGTAVTNAVRLCTVSDLTSYCLDVEIPPSDSTRVSVGQEVRLTFPSMPDLTMTSTVESIRDESSIRLARIIIYDADPRVTVGTAVRAQIIVQAIPDALIVPIDSITIGDDGFARLNVLLDPSRGIKTEVLVNIIATNATQAAISADNIQEGNSVILNSSLAEADQAQNPTDTDDATTTTDGTATTTSTTATEGAEGTEGTDATATPAPTAEEIQANADELSKKAEESQQAAQEAADRAAALLGEEPMVLGTDEVSLGEGSQDEDITTTGDSEDTDSEETTEDEEEEYE